VSVADATAPFFGEAFALVEARAGRFAETFRDAIARVHHRLPAERADAAAIAGVHHGGVRVDGAHVEDRRRSGERHFRETEIRARAERRFVVRGFERPHARAEPFEK